MRIRRGRELATVAMLAFALGMLLLHYVHLRADFPNWSPWSDWSKYTDEGWYGDAAIRHYLRGNWRLAGDFNPGVALPVWPLLEAALFRFTGVGIVAARALTVTVFAGILVCSYLLIRHEAAPKDDHTGRGYMGACAAAAVALLAGSPFVFVFTRIAILEPLLILLMLLALLVAWAVRSAQERRTRIAFAVALGGLFALMVGTKTTAIFLLPAIGFLLGNSANWRPRRLLLLLAVAGATAALLWSTYLALLVHAGYFQDFRYLFDANGYTAITAATLLPVLWATISDGMWMGPALYPVVLLVVAGASFRTEARRDPVFVSLLLWAAGYMAFMAYHANMQPRYYLVVVVPLVLAAARGAGHLLAWRREASWLLAPLTAALLIVAAATTVHFARHPEYSFQAAAERIERIVEAEPNHSHTVLSISGSNLSLMTGLPSICDDFGTMNLEDRIAAYHPGWFVAWNYVEDDKMAALGKFYRLTRVAAFPAMDDPERNLMIVYRLDPREGIRPRRRKPGARILPTALGVPASP